MEDSVLKLLETGTDQDIWRILKEFNAKYEKQYTPVSGTSDTSKRLWNVIMSRLNDSQAAHIHQTCLDSLRILSRDKSTLNDVIDQERLSVIVRLAGLVPEEEALQNLNQQINYQVVLEAQKCLSNLVFQSQTVQKWCCVNSCIPGLMCRLKTFRDPDLPHLVKLFDIRLLFLLTATCAHVRPQLRTEYHGLTYLIEVIDLIVNSAQEKISPPSLQSLPSPIINLSIDQCDLVQEVLKVLYNLVLHIDKTQPDEEEEGHCLRLSSILRCLILANGPTQKSTTELHRHTVNLLVVLPAMMYEGLLTDMPVATPQPPATASTDGATAVTTANTTQPITTPPKACPLPSTFHDTNCTSSDQMPQSTNSDAFYDACEYDGKDMSAIISLLKFLDTRLNALGESASENLTPILTLCIEMVQVNRIIRKFIRLRVLPPLRDATKLPEEGNALRNKLCLLMTSPLHDIKYLSANFLFILCKESVDRLIKYTGYGNAAGLLASRGLMLGGRVPNANYSDDSDESDTEEYEKLKDQINPVTGRCEPPRPSPFEGMSEEQKEHEAIKLVNVLDKLTRNNIIQPCKIGEDGKPVPVEHVLELHENLVRQHPQHNNEDNDSDEDN